MPPGKSNCYSILLINFRDSSASDDISEGHLPKAAVPQQSFGEDLLHTGVLSRGSYEISRLVMTTLDAWEHWPPAVVSWRLSSSEIITIAGSNVETYGVRSQYLSYLGLCTWLSCVHIHCRDSVTWNSNQFGSSAFNWALFRPKRCYILTIHVICILMAALLFC